MRFARLTLFLALCGGLGCAEQTTPKPSPSARAAAPKQAKAEQAERRADDEEEVLELVETNQVLAAQKLASESGVDGIALVRLEGILNHAVRDADAALDPLQRAVADDPDDAHVGLRLAEVYCWKHEAQQARPLIEATSVERLKELERPWEELRRAARVWGCLEEFERGFSMLEAVEQVPDVPARELLATRVQRAELSAWQKDFESAGRIVDAVLVEVPGHVGASLVKGQLLEWQGRYKEALATYRAAFRLHPGEPAVRDRLLALEWVKK
ncbi:MAG: hypothetical protein QM756_27320 [Polyangiaceae bacterium]